jgi:tyrosyl-tRNA synthetase
MTSQDAFQLIQHGACDLIGAETLKKKLESGTPLRIKAGFDPTAPDLHLGHSVLFTKLRQFQALGHQIIFLIGDFTGLIGDPSGRNAMRPSLTQEEVQQNAATYQAQFTKVLDPQKTQLCFNSEWLNPLSARELIQIASTHTVARMLERDDFHKRYQQQHPIGIHEFLYPLLQAYDSVRLKADVELGGTDQLFNLLLGRELQKHMGLEPQAVLTMPLLEGLDGTQKMSKSLNNYISLQEDAFQMFSKLMSISDELMWRYFQLLSLEKTPEELNRMQARTSTGEANPRDYKIELALELTTRYHGHFAATSAKTEFEQRFRHGQIPSDITEITLTTQHTTLSLPQLLQQAGLTHSTSEAIRLIQSGAVRVDHQKVYDKQFTITQDGLHLYQVGKRRFAKIQLKQSSTLSPNKNEK